MEFCEKCGGLIMLTEKAPKCSRCNHKPKHKPKLQSSEKIEKKELVTVIKEKDSNTNPIVEMKCTKCKNHKCYFWTMQTRAADESETKFFKCTKCNHTWRVYR